MPSMKDGPATSTFRPVPFRGNTTFAALKRRQVSAEMVEALDRAPQGECVSWGIPFTIERPAIPGSKPMSLELSPVKAQWLVFLHTTDLQHPVPDEHGIISPTSGRGRLNEHVATYTIGYDDGTSSPLKIRRRHHIGMVQRGWGENCVQAVGHRKPSPVPANHEQRSFSWGNTQTRARQPDMEPWMNWLHAWENPHPEKTIVSLRVKLLTGTLVLSGLSAGNCSDTPLRWKSRRKALLTLPEGQSLNPTLDEQGLLSQIQLDMGQVISAQPQTVYPNRTWNKTANAQSPTLSKNKVLIEYTAHPDAAFHLGDGKQVKVSELKRSTAIVPLKPASQNVRVRVVARGTKTKVSCRLHIHGAAGEYLPPNDRHRIPNPMWFEDYAPEYVHQGVHRCTYIDGDATVKLPLGQVYIEVSKGFEIKPVRLKQTITSKTTELEIELDKVLPWRENDWVTADTHVHFLSPQTALLEGAAEGVNIINLLASQWGELMTNAGDFDGETTHGSRESGGDGEYLVRVGTENRQHVMGHISLLGYEGSMITPMTTGGPRESAIGDPLEVLLTEWARQCKDQNGLVVIPHFPNPRLENAATIVSGNADAVEMCRGISPYSLSDWYRYLNCGYAVAAVGGTDKMAATTAIGQERTYAQLPKNVPFTYDAWKQAVRDGNTFVSCGPLMEFQVDGQGPGSRINMTANGGTVHISWKVASVTMPMTGVELIVNGEVHSGKAVDADGAEGTWTMKVKRSSWFALLVRGRQLDGAEVIAAHSSAVMINVEDSHHYAAADALTILEQIEGALAYLDVLATRTETTAYKCMKMVLTSTHRELHNRMHALGHFHEHTVTENHKEHRRDR